MITTDLINENLKAVNTIMSFLSNENSKWGDLVWRDKDNEGFETDQGYLVEGLGEFESYLKRKLGEVTE